MYWIFEGVCRLEVLGEGMYDAGVLDRGNCLYSLGFCCVLYLGMDAYSSRTLLKFISSMTLLKLVVDWRSVVTECSAGDGDNNECGGVILLFKGLWVGDVYFVVYNPGWIDVFFKFIGEIFLLKTSDTGACGVI